MASNFIPPASHQVLNPDGTLTLPWRQFFQNVYQQGGGASGNTSTIAALQAAVAALQGQVAIDATSAAQAVSAATQALTQSQYAGVALALASVADESEYSSSGSSGGLIVSGPSLTAPPTVRGSSASLYNSAAPVVSFPAGTIVGDFVVVFIESAYSVTSPTGWTVLDNSGHGSTSFGAFTKIMTSADITAGSVTINCGGGYNGVWACVSFQNATGGVRAFASNFSGSSPIVATTSGSPMAGDYEIVFGGTRGANSTVVSSDGAVLQYQAAVGQDASGAIYGRTLSASGAVSPSVAFSVIDGFTSAGVYVVVVEGGPGVVSQSVTEIDFSGAPVAVSYPVTGKAAVAITGTIDVQSSGSDLGNATALNFTGSGVSVSETAGVATVAISSGSGVALQSSGTGLGTATTLNFTGAGVTTTYASGTGTVTITGGGGAGSNLISKHTCGTGETTFTFSGIPATFHDLDLVVVGKQTNATNQNCLVTINGLSTGIYDTQRTYRNSNGGGSNDDQALAQTAWGSFPALGDSSQVTGMAGAFRVRLYDYLNTSFYKQGEFTGRQQQDNATGGAFFITGVIQAETTAAISSITIAIPAGAFVAGTTFSLFGI